MGTSSKNTGKVIKPKRLEASFTQLRIREYPTPDKGRIFVYDTGQDYLRMQITKAGTKTYQFYMWVKGRGATTITIGRIEKITVDDARKKTKELTGDITKDGAKAVDELNAVSKESTFEELFLSWLDDKETENGKTAHLKDCKAKFKNHLKPTIGRKKVSTLTKDYLKRWHRNLIKRTVCNGAKKNKLTRTTANRCLEIVSAVFNATMDSNPAKDIIHFKEQSRERYLQPAEIIRLFEAMDKTETSPDMKDIVLLALTTGARKQNILSMSWKEVDLTNGLWIIPADKSKNKESMYVPLIPEAIELLERRAAVAKTFHVFPAKTKTGHICTIFKRFRKLLELAEIEEFRFHDLRRTCGSWQALQGGSALMIGKSLGHKSTESTAVYARIAEHSPVRDSMNKGFTAMLKASKSKKIVNIGGGK